MQVSQAQFELTRARDLLDEIIPEQVKPLEEVREQIGPDIPVYLSFDIDGLDPSVAPGTGTPEPGGLTASQGIEIIQAFSAVNQGNPLTLSKPARRSEAEERKGKG